MSIFLPDPLTREELTALKAIAVTPPLRGLPYKIQRRLVDLGFAQTVRGGLMATEDGLLRIQLEHEKESARLSDAAPRWHMFEEKREAVMAIEAAVLSLVSTSKELAA